ncbi:low-complexity tail membrane protein [Capilliphycus salinus ALCB114379]|uniref:low-complexity tail membrane protein n=1 Tax=Capilliphycus salinus TaxID=2768948 RepID=UPI0039A696BF
MSNFRLDPYLWIHLSGLAALPLWLAMSLLGLAIGYPIWPVGVEIAIVAAIGIVPILVMQWFKPFYIFSVLIVAIKPEQLTPQQCQILTRFKTPLNQRLAIIAPLLLIPVLWQLYRLAPLAAEVVSLPPQGRLLGLSIASLGFLGCNLFLQVPISAIAVLFTPKTQLAAREPLTPDSIRQGFTRIGLQVNRILPRSLLPSTPENSLSSLESREPTET